MTIIVNNWNYIVKSPSLFVEDLSAVDGKLRVVKIECLEMDLQLVWFDNSFNSGWMFYGKQRTMWMLRVFDGLLLFLYHQSNREDYCISQIKFGIISIEYYLRKQCLCYYSITMLMLGYIFIANWTNDKCVTSSSGTEGSICYLWNCCKYVV